MTEIWIYSAYSILCKTDRERRMKIEEMKDSAEGEREGESQPHEWGERRFNQASSKYRAPQSHFKTCRDIFILHTQIHTDAHSSQCAVSSLLLPLFLSVSLSISLVIM